MPVKIPQSLKKMLEDKAYGHVVTFNAQGKPERTMAWMDIEGDELRFNTAEGRRKPDNIRRDPRVIVSVEDCNHPQACAVFHGRGRVTAAGADAHIDKLAKRFLVIDKYPFRRPTEKRLIVRTLVALQHTHFDVTSDLLRGVTRSFRSFTDALEEVKNARIFSGIHFRTACGCQATIVHAKNPIGLPIVELAAFRLLASSEHGQPYINVAQVPSHRPSKPSCYAGRDHRAPSSTDRAAANSKDKNRLILGWADRCLWVWLSRLWSLGALP